MNFACEPLTRALLDEAMPLLAEHWKEVAHYPDIPLNVDTDGYLRAAEAGLLRCYTVRTALGDLVGYALYFVTPNPHYAQSIQAKQDVIYLHPSVRGGTGYKFIAWCDEQLASEGVVATYQHVKAAHNFGKLLERQGYELVDLIYAKRLDGWKYIVRIADIDASQLTSDSTRPWSAADETNDLARTVAK